MCLATGCRRCFNVFFDWKSSVFWMFLQTGSHRCFDVFADRKSSMFWCVCRPEVIDVLLCLLTGSRGCLDVFADRKSRSCATSAWTGRRCGWRWRRAGRALPSTSSRSSSRSACQTATSRWSGGTRCLALVSGRRCAGRARLWRRDSSWMHSDQAKADESVEAACKNCCFCAGVKHWNRRELCLHCELQTSCWLKCTKLFLVIWCQWQYSSMVETQCYELWLRVVVICSHYYTVYSCTCTNWHTTWLSQYYVL